MMRVRKMTKIRKRRIEGPNNLLFIKTNSWKIFKYIQTIIFDSSLNYD